jgi:hypothetical protein
MRPQNQQTHPTLLQPRTDDPRSIGGPTVPVARAAARASPSLDPSDQQFCTAEFLVETQRARA